jgi:hypothetical protein
LESDSLKALKKRKNIDIIQTYEQTQSAFAKPRLKPQQSTIVFRNTFDYTFSDEGVFKLIPEREFSPDFNIKIHDSLINSKNKMIVVKYKLKVPYYDIHNTAIVLSLESSGRAYVWKSIVLKDYIKDINDWNDVYLYCIVPKEMKDGDVIKSYIWNKSKKNIFILNAEIKWLEYQ